MWIQPIFNRDNTAHYNVSDFNRIEQDCGYLAVIFGVTITIKEWNRTGKPNVSDYARIQNNIATLRAAYYTYSTTPSMPSVPLNEYHKANDLEKILNDLKALYDDNARDIFYAGEVYSGELIGVI